MWNILSSTATVTARTSRTPSRASAGVFLVSRRLVLSTRVQCSRLHVTVNLQLIKPTSSAPVWLWCAKVADSDSLVVYVLSCEVLGALRDHWDNKMLNWLTVSSSLQYIRLSDVSNELVLLFYCTLTPTALQNYGPNRSNMSFQSLLLNQSETLIRFLMEVFQPLFYFSRSQDQDLWPGQEEGEGGWVSPLWPHGVWWVRAAVFWRWEVSKPLTRLKWELFSSLFLLWIF